MKTFWVLLSITLLAGVAGASTVTFDSYSPLDTCMSPISSEGLTFTGGDCANNYMYAWDGSAPNSNGTPGLIYGFTSFVAVTATGGGSFNLTDLQMTISFYDSNPSEDVLLTAFFSAGGSTSQTLTLLQGLQTYTLNLSNLSEVDISAVPSASGYWLLDNVNYNTNATAPEPGTLVLVGSSLLAGFGVLRRKLKR